MLVTVSPDSMRLSSAGQPPMNSIWRRPAAELDARSSSHLRGRRQLAPLDVLESRPVGRRE
jgi:hypothetical protein